MSNSTLQRFDTENGIELIIDTKTGESFATISGYARMSGKDKSTISRRKTTVAENDVKTAEIQTKTGVKTVVLIDGKTALTWLAQDNPSLLAAMAECGWNVYCHKMAGFEVNSTAIQVPKTYAEALLEAGRLAKELEEAEKERELLMLQNQDLEEENELQYE